MDESEAVRRALDSRQACLQALRDGFAQAAAQGCREIWCCDAAYADWPLSEPAVIDSLTRWALAHRKLTLLAGSFDEMHRRHARWVAWRRNWAHVVDCRMLHEDDARSAPSLLLLPDIVTVRIIDPLRYRGTWSSDPADSRRCRESIDALSQRSADSFPATTLGL